jgi:hypothetical protein
MPTQAEKETRAAFARRMGVNKSTVTRWGDTGRLVEQGGMVLVAETLARVAATTAHRNDVAARHAAGRGADIPSPQPSAENAPKGRKTNQEETGFPGDLPEAGGRQRFQALVMQFENQSIKLEMALRRGLRFPREAVKHEAHGLGSMLRAALERMIDIAAPQLAAEKSEAARHALIANELDKVRRSIKREFPRALRRMRGAA